MAMRNKSSAKKQKNPQKKSAGDAVAQSWSLSFCKALACVKSMKDHPHARQTNGK